MTALTTMFYILMLLTAWYRDVYEWLATITEPMCLPDLTLTIELSPIGLHCTFFSIYDIPQPKFNE